MRKIFVLKGKSNTGKTTKINKVADWIITHYPCTNTINLNPSNYQQDTHGILVINKLSIGVNSAGDDLPQLQKLKKLKINENYPDIIICSCRTKGQTHQYINKNFNKSTEWLKVFINVDEYLMTDIVNQGIRDTRIIDELKSWLIGLEKV